MKTDRSVYTYGRSVPGQDSAGHYGRFPKFHRVVLGRDPGTLKSDIVSKKTSTINLSGFETLKLKSRRLKLLKPTVSETQTAACQQTYSSKTRRLAVNFVPFGGVFGHGWSSHWGVQESSCQSGVCLCINCGLLVLLCCITGLCFRRGKWVGGSLGRVGSVSPSATVSFQNFMFVFAA